LRRSVAVHSTLELTTGELDALAASLALQAYIHAKSVNDPASTSTRVEFLEADYVSDLPRRERH
jgi:hypothetical protein